MPEYSGRIQVLLTKLTLEEKVALLAGASFWYTVPIERLGIPAIKVTDGPNGTRGEGHFGSGTPTTCFPAGIALAASWDVEQVRAIGQALGAEVRAKGAQVILGPTVNIQRTPLNGRNFETYSEDPHLAARLAVAYIQGVQSQGVGTSIKHFAGNNSEFERNTISSEIRERALREIYLVAFEAAVAEADPWTVMSAYNKLNGTFCGENPELLTRILKEEWGWDGLVMSDWFGTHSTAAAANAGLDLEMPGPTQWRGAKLVAAVQEGAVAPAVIDEAASRVLHLIERAGALDTPPDPTEHTIDTPELRALVRRAAADGMVLLKNDGLLPLDSAQLQRVAIIGPNAKTAVIMGGGSAQVNAPYGVTPFAGITAQLGPHVAVSYALGCTNHRFLPRLTAAQMVPEPGSGADPTAQGLGISYYNSLDLSGPAVYTTIVANSEVAFFEEPGHGVDPRAFSTRLSGRFTPEESGPYTFGLASSGLARLLVDGQLVVDNWTAQTPGTTFYGTGSAEKLGTATLQAGQPVTLVVEYSRQGAGALAGMRLGALPPVPDDAIAQAAALAATADVALVCVGTNGEWESEGADRTDLDLPGDQDALVAAVAAANPHTVVVVQTGSPIAMPWLAATAAVLEAWFPGQECGNAIADVLFGRVDAAGRLPQTFPVRLPDHPAYINYPGEHGKVYYGEGVFVGYRYYEKKEITPLFPFGFGLSYTTFDYANLRLSADTFPAAGIPAGTRGMDEMVPEAAALDVLVDVTNSGARPGSEVVQLYVRDPEASVPRPAKELKAFAKVALQPGETRTVRLTLDRRALAYYDETTRRWVAERGTFEVLVGRSSADIRLSAVFTLAETVHFGGPGQPPPRLSAESNIHDLLADERARAILDRHLPGFSSDPRLGFASGFSLAQLAAFDAQTFTPALLQAITADLAQPGDGAHR